MTEGESRSALHAVVYYPDLDSPELDEFREEHDPFATVIREHLTLVFPVPVEGKQVCDHVRSVAEEVEPFDIHIRGLNRTWDHWLYLEIEEGRKEVVTLHDRLYTGPLRCYLRKDLPYEPHIGIGFFGTGSYDPLNPTEVELDVQRVEAAWARATSLDIAARRRVDLLTVVRLDREAGLLDDVEEVPLRH